MGYIGLGSNVGEREQHLRRAVSELGRHEVTVEAVSSLYETEPVGEILDQPDFLNAAARIRTALDPEKNGYDAETTWTGRLLGTAETQRRVSDFLAGKR